MRLWRLWRRCSTGWRGLRRDEAGQGTVEFALVTCGFLAVVLGLGALYHLGADGALGDHALRSASHVLAASPAFVLADIFAV